jgi:hypothetical protein
MTALDQKQLGKAMWNIADQLRGPGRETGDSFHFSSNTLKTHKKGLMQQLSPAPEGI